MLRSEIISLLADQNPNIRHSDLEKIVEILIYEMIEALCSDCTVEIRGAFRLSIKKAASYMGRNPKTGSLIQIPSKRKIKFKASTVLLKKLNNDFTENKISANN
jgi:integration host factor subunit beta